MLEIIEGALTSTAREEFNREIVRAVKEGKRTYLIVPEQQAVIAESEMALLLPDNAPTLFEVTNFTRLANTVFRTLGGVAARYCDKTTRHLIMWKTLTELSPTLSLTGGKKEVSVGAVEKALTAVLEMKSLGVTVDELDKITSSAPKTEKRLMQKLSDLSKIMALYKTLLTESYVDAADDVDVMNEKVLGHPDVFSGCCFFITGFTSFTEPQYRFIGTLARVATLTVHLTLPRAGADSYEYTEPRLARERILRLADMRGVEKKVRRVGTRDESRDEVLSEVCDLLWHTGAKIDNSSLQDNDSVRVFEAATPYEEFDFISADIRGRVAKGAKYRDFAIIARDSDRYLGILDTALRKYKIPAFISRRVDIASFEAIKLIYSAYAAITGGYRRDDVITYAKCTPGDITRDECDELELYIETWQINGRRFHPSEIWNMPPSGYTVRHPEGEDEMLLRINRIKDRLISPLTRLEEELGRARTVREHATALIGFLSEIELERNIRERSDLLRELGEVDAASDNLELWQIIINSLDTLVSVLGECECDADGFLAELKVTFASADIGRLPSYFDGVTVGSADMLRLIGKDYVYLIGVNRQEFPMAPSEGTYFNDRDRETLSALGLGISPELNEKRARELYYFSRAFSYAKKSVTLTYSTLSESFVQKRPSDVIERLYDMSDGKIAPKRISDIPREELIYSPEGALESLGEFDTGIYDAVKHALIKEGFEDEVTTAELTAQNKDMTLSEDSLLLIYDKDLALTQSRIDSYSSCPFAFFCRYGLSLSEEERAEFDARNIGSFIHAILESFFYEVRRDGLDVKSLDGKKKRELVYRGAEKYLELLELDLKCRSKRESLMLERITRSALPVIDGICDELAESGFMPRYFELKIEKGTEGLPEAARFKTEDGGTVSVYGSIDRVDTYECGGEIYVRVIDYKTGQKAFSPSDIKNGKNLQMFLYLKSIVDTKNESFLRELGVAEGKSPIPAGVTYVKTELGDVKIDIPDDALAHAEVLGAQERSGMMLNDPNVILATNPKYSPVKSKRTANRYYTLEGWEELSKTLEEVVCDIGSRMKRGEIPARPRASKSSESPCNLCKFAPFCRSVK